MSYRADHGGWLRTWVGLALVGVALAGAAVWTTLPDVEEEPEVVEGPVARRTHVFDFDEGPKGSLDAGPDLLFVTWDTVRADHTSLHGYPRPTTPFLQELAQESVVFERFIVPMSTTLPSHVTLFTGTSPDEHGVLSNVTVSGVRFEPPESMETLAGHLRDRGWHTAAFVSSTPLKQGTGIADGFVHFDQPRGRDRIAADTMRQTLQWLDTAPDDQPLFVWVHLVDPHWPWEPPPPTAGAMPPDDLLRMHIAERDFGEITARRSSQILSRLAGYDEEILYTDDQTRRLVGRWREKRDWDRTVFVLAGDHGEGLGEHDHLEHGLLWHEQLRTILLMRAPGLAARRVDDPVAGADVLPTLMGIAEFPDVDGLHEQSSGVDVLASDFEARPVFSRLSLRQVKRKKKAASFSLTDHRWKLVADVDGNTFLYDLDADPHERTDVSADHPQLVERWCARGEATLRAQRIRAHQFGLGRERTVPVQELQELKELGYLE